MKSRRIRRIPHHAAKLLTLAIPAFSVSQALEDNGPWYQAASWAVQLLLLGLAGLYVLHHLNRFETDCCPLRTGQDLQRPLFRLAVLAARLWWIPALLACTGMFLAAIAKEYISHTPWLGIALLTLIGWSVLATASARIFRFNNQHLVVTPASEARSAALRDRFKVLIHKSHWLMIGTNALTITVLLLAPHEGIWNVLRLFVLLHYFLALYVDMAHSAKPCEECAVEFRTDAPEYAARRRKTLAVHHKPTFFTAPSLLAGAMSLFFNGVWADALWSASAVLGLTLALFNRFHRAYQPWCPFCRHGGRGDEREEVPDPTGGHGRPVPAT